MTWLRLTLTTRRTAHPAKRLKVVLSFGSINIGFKRQLRKHRLALGVDYKLLDCTIVPFPNSSKRRAWHSLKGAFEGMQLFSLIAVLQLVLAVVVTGDSALNWTLHLVDDPTGTARCLDGSPPGYYVRPGFGSGRNKWIIHLQGGGWCITREDCISRASGYNPSGQPSLGGTGTWPRTGSCPDSSLPPCASDGGEHGMLSPNATTNPDWYSANAVFVGYW